MTNAIAIAIETERQMKEIDMLASPLFADLTITNGFCEDAQNELLANISDDLDIEFEIIEIAKSRNSKPNFYHVGWSVLMLWATWLVTIIA